MPLSKHLKTGECGDMALFLSIYYISQMFTMATTTTSNKKTFQLIMKRIFQNYKKIKNECLFGKACE